MFRRLIAVLALAIACALVTSPARAEWHKAETERFVVYSDTSEKDIREFAERLERYHVAMTKVTGRNPPAPSPSNRVTVYAVGSDTTLRKLYGDKSSNVGGFYMPRAGGSVAFVPNVDVRGRDTDFTLIILLHEYAHHFTMSSNPYALPRWVNEGSAEFFASVKFAPDGGLDIGLPAEHRVPELTFARQLSIEQLLDYDRYAGEGGPRRDAFYGQSWMLFHYLMFSEERLPQYQAYAKKFFQGMPSLDAAKEAFGDLDELEKELKAYQRKTRIPAIRLNSEALPIGEIKISDLSEGMDAMMGVILKSRRGVTREQALELLPEAREVASKFPNDPGVLSALAEAEFDAGNDAEAIAAADRAIAADKNAKNAYIQKGYALFRQAEEAEDKDAAYTLAMKPFEALNAIENDHPLPLIYYHRSFVERGLEPEENAKAALERASQLAPFDRGLRLNVALMLIGEGQNQIASLMLRPLAADPHGRGGAERAKELIASLEALPDGERLDVSAIMAELNGEEGAGEEGGDEGDGEGEGEGEE